MLEVKTEETFHQIVCLKRNPKSFVLCAVGEREGKSKTRTPKPGLWQPGTGRGTA